MSDTIHGTDRCPECGGAVTEKSIVVDGNAVAAEVAWLYCLSCGWDNRSGTSDTDRCDEDLVIDGGEKPGDGDPNGSMSGHVHNRTIHAMGLSMLGGFFAGFGSAMGEWIPIANGIVLAIIFGIVAFWRLPDAQIVAVQWRERQRQEGRYD